jgi:hypothetical protein
MKTNLFNKAFSHAHKDWVASISPSTKAVWGEDWFQVGLDTAREQVGLTLEDPMKVRCSVEGVFSLCFILNTCVFPCFLLSSSGGEDDGPSSASKQP